MIENSTLDRWANVDWATLKAEDPLEFALKRDEFRDEQDKIRRAQEEHNRMTHLQNQEHQRLFQEARQSESEALAAALPDWAELEKQRELADQLRVYANSVGF